MLYLNKQFYENLAEVEKDLPEDEKTFASDMAKGLVSYCVRNNTILDDIHSGELTLTNDVMKQLMIECTDNVYMFMVALLFGQEQKCEIDNDKKISVDELAQALLANRSECKNWNKAEFPKWAKRIAEWDM